MGGVLLLVGLGLALYTVAVWKQRQFGSMELRAAARLVIPAATSMALGVEIMLFSFFLSTLGLSIRHHQPAVPELP